MAKRIIRYDGECPEAIAATLVERQRCVNLLMERAGRIEDGDPVSATALRLAAAKMDEGPPDDPAAGCSSATPR